MLVRLKSNDRAVAYARIGLGLCTITYGLESSVTLGLIIESGFRMPVLEFIPAPSHPTEQIYLGVTAFAGILLILGLFASAAAATAALANVSLLVLDQQTYTNHGWLLTILLFLLIWAQPDRELALRRTADAGGTRSLWVSLLMMTQISICYLFAGISKINAGFLSGEDLDGWIRLDLPTFIDRGMAISTILTEVFLAFGLWFYRTRILAVVLGCLLHASIVSLISSLTFPLFTFAVVCVCMYPLYFTLQRREAAGVPGTQHSKHAHSSSW